MAAAPIPRACGVTISPRAVHRRAVEGVIWSMPPWFGVVLGLIPPLLWLVGSRRAAERNAWALCVTCGYDLRASPDRCPECQLTSSSERVLQFPATAA